MAKEYNDSYEKGDNYVLDDDEYDPYPGTWDDEDGDLLENFDNDDADSILEEIECGKMNLEEM